MARWTADPERYARDAGFVPRLAGPLLDLAGPLAGLRVLDLGCGDGSLTARVAQQAGDLVAVDADPAMVAATAARGIEARRADAQTLVGVDGPFDVVLSNAVLHWVPDHARVAAAVRGVLRPGGRFVAEFGGHGNVAAVRVALRAALDETGHAEVSAPAWTFPTVDEAGRTLVEAGFEVDQIGLHPRPTEVPAGISGWLATFAGDVLADVHIRSTRGVGEPQTDVLDAAERLLAPVLRDGAGRWTADYVRLRFAARRPD